MFSAVTTVSALAFYPAPAKAGFFDFWQETAEASSPSGAMSVQTMPLLKPAMNINPNPAKGGGEVVIEDENAVVAQGGFAGETVMPQKDAISIYVVGEGDTLSEIAEMFGVSMNTIKWANDLPSTTAIHPGQVLTILPVSGLKYTVKSGDTLASIAKKYKGDETEIARFNGVSGSLAAGTEIIIPNGQEEVVHAAAPAKSNTPGKPSPSYAGYYKNPVPGGTRTQGVHGTNGVDLAAPVGAPFIASASGEVIIAREGGWNGGYGSYVVIKHDNGTQTLYAHATSLIVGIGEDVVQGQVIGYVGQTGKATGPHVHFEIRGGPRNPF